MDLIFLGPRAAGMGRYALGLLSSLLSTDPGLRVTAIIGRQAPPELFDAVPKERVQWVKLPLYPGGTLSHRLAQRVVEPLIARLARLDVFHTPAALGPVGMKAVPTVTTVLDNIWLDHPQPESAANGVSDKTAISILRTLRKADRVLTFAEEMKNQLVSRFGVPEQRIDRVPLGVTVPSARTTYVPETVLRERYALSERPVILCVAQKHPYKNLQLLISVMTRLRDRHPILVLPGSRTPHEAELRLLAAQTGVAEDVRFPDWLTEMELEGFYRLATCVVLPSFVEGFGLPVLEAMVRGVPVACSNRWSLPEVANGAALLFDPGSAEEAAGAISRILSDPDLRRRLSKEGNRNAAAFTWERCAEGTLASYRRSIEARGTRNRL